MTAATIVAALACLAAQGEEWELRPLKAGDLHRVEMAEDSSGVNFVRDPETNALKPIRETLRRRVVYRQRMLPSVDPKAPEAFPYRALCLFEKLESTRESQGKKLVNFNLRDDVKLLALDPRAALSTAWSPRGPLRVEELHTVSHLVFVPALNGLLPNRKVRWGDKWAPTRATLEHLSTLQPLTAADVVCQCRQTMEYRGESLLQISVKGTMEGEDRPLGRATDQLDGGLYIRPADGTIHSLNLRAERRIVDEKGAPVATWNIDFGLNLRPLAEAPPELAEAEAAKLAGPPAPADLAVIAPFPQAAVEILHPRTWRPDRVGEAQFELLHNLRNERLRLDFEPDGKTPTIEEFDQRVTADFAKAKGVKLLGYREGGQPRPVSHGTKGSADYGYAGQFFMRADHAGVERVHIYLVWQLGNRGATAMASCAPADFDACAAEVRSVVKGLKFTAASFALPAKPAAAAGN